jgi:4a-hydroxytetrahydrobiopterin dehydratase
MGAQDTGCVTCKEAIKALTRKEEDEQLSRLTGWDLVLEGVHKISKKYSFRNFRENVAFVNAIAGTAESAGHHPDLHLYYSTLHVELSTHALKGLSPKDFSLAARIDELYNRQKAVKQ